MPKHFYQIEPLLNYFFVFLITGLIGLMGCGPGSQELPDKIVVATDATLVPMSFINDQNKIDGFEKDLITAIAKEMGVGLEIVNVEWAGLLGGLLTQKYNAAISSITILKERKEKMAFSIPYLKSGLSIVVRLDSEGISTMKDLQEKNLLVAAQRGTTAYFYLKDHSGVRSVGYEQYGHAIQDLIKGEVDAVLGESTGTLYYKKNENAIFKKIKMVGDILTNEYYGIAVRKKDNLLLKSIDKALGKLIQNGTVQDLHTKWELGRAAMVPKNQPKS